MKLRDALDQKLLRVVPLQDNGWMQSYKDEEPVDYRDYLGKEIALVNFYGKFIFIKNKVVAQQTLSSVSGVSLLYVDLPSNEVKQLPNVSVNKSKFIKAELLDEILDTNIVNLSEVKNEFVDTRFADLAIKVINHQLLSDRESISLLVDSRLLNVFEYADLVELTQDGVVYEIASRSTPRARLYLQEIRDGVIKPKALELFDKNEIAILKKAVRLV